MPDGPRTLDDKSTSNNRLQGTLVGGGGQVEDRWWTLAERFTVQCAGWGMDTRR